MSREPIDEAGVSRSAIQSAYEKHNVVHLDSGRVGSRWLCQCHPIFQHRYRQHDDRHDTRSRRSDFHADIDHRQHRCKRHDEFLDLERIVNVADSVVHLTKLQQFDFERLYTVSVHRFDLRIHAVGPEHDQ